MVREPAAGCHLPADRAHVTAGRGSLRRTWQVGGAQRCSAANTGVNRPSIPEGRGAEGQVSCRVRWQGCCPRASQPGRWLLLLPLRNEESRPREVEQLVQVEPASPQGTLTPESGVFLTTPVWRVSSSMPQFTCSGTFHYCKKIKETWNARRGFEAWLCHLLCDLGRGLHACELYLSYCTLYTPVRKSWAGTNVVLVTLISGGECLEDGVGWPS